MDLNLLNASVSTLTWGTLEVVITLSKMLHTVHLDFLFIAIFGTNCVITANLYTDDGFINVLNSKNFAELVTTQPTVVQFYLPQCGACQNYAPIYKTLSKSISSSR